MLGRNNRSAALFIQCDQGRRLRFQTTTLECGVEGCGIVPDPANVVHDLIPVERRVLNKSELPGSSPCPPESWCEVRIMRQPVPAGSLGGTGRRTGRGTGRL